MKTLLIASLPPPVAAGAATISETSVVCGESHRPLGITRKSKDVLALGMQHQILFVCYATIKMSTKGGSVSFKADICCQTSYQEVEVNKFEQLSGLFKCRIANLFLQKPTSLDCMPKWERNALESGSRNLPSTVSQRHCTSDAKLSRSNYRLQILAVGHDDAKNECRLHKTTHVLRIKCIMSHLFLSHQTRQAFGWLLGDQKSDVETWRVQLQLQMFLLVAIKQFKPCHHPEKPFGRILAFFMAQLYPPIDPEKPPNQPACSKGISLGI